MHTNIERLEQDVLEMLLKGADPVLAVLRKQLECCTRRRPKESGVGFFGYLDVTANAPPLPDNTSIRFGDVSADIPELQHGAGFVLFVDNGVLTMLEGYTYGEPWPSVMSGYNLKYTSGDTRDYNALRTTPGWPNMTQG